MPLEIKCPNCGRIEKVPNGAIGHTAKCPGCGSIIKVVQPSAASPEAVAVDDPFATPAPWVPVQLVVDLRSIRSKVQGPATSLIVTAVVGLGLSVMMIQNYFQMKSMRPMYQNMGEFMERQPGTSDEDAQHVRATMDTFSSMLSSSGTMSLVTGLLGVASGVIVIAGAVSMMSLRRYPLAVTAAVLSMIPMISPCCLLGLPFGIWSLIVLLQPDVRSAFP